MQPREQIHDPRWEQSVISGLLALTEHGRASWKLDTRLHGAMRCDWAGESFWLWRGRLMIEEDLELRLKSIEGRQLRKLVEAMRDEQIRDWHEQAEQRKVQRKARVDRALELVVEAGEAAAES
jgi:hypothetical protein